jgi:hypothetical protein
MPIVGSISIEWQENHRLTIEKELMKRVEVQLKKNFEAVGSCELFTEPDVIKEKVIEAAKGLAKPVIESWEHYPEMVGEVSIEKPLPSASKRTVVVEVVSDRPTLREVYRLKRIIRSYDLRISFQSIDFPKCRTVTYNFDNYSSL